MVVQMIDRTCPECGRTFQVKASRLAHGRGKYCSHSCRAKHVLRGLPRCGVARRSVEERFWPKVQKSDGCWLWTGSHHTFGYGQMGGAEWRDGPVFAHRVSWELHYGDIPPGLFVLHHCDNPPCVRPDHLFLGTHADNMADMVAKGRAAPPSTRARGERSGSAKLTNARVRELRDAYIIGEPRKQIAAEFGVSQRMVWLIGTGRSWAHVS